MLEQLQQDMEEIVRELTKQAELSKGSLLVIGTSTSEVMGKRIGTSGGSEVIARSLFTGLDKVRQEVGFYPAFQCCEHLNRALVLEREAADKYGLEQVSAVPIPGAGGSMAAYAYRHIDRSVLVENIQAHAGIDIGDTLIGMHLRPVAVPVRPSIRKLGEAHVTMARTRPKLIGGARAVYNLPELNSSDHCN